MISWRGDDHHLSRPRRRFPDTKEESRELLLLAMCSSRSVAALLHDLPDAEVDLQPVRARLELQQEEGGDLHQVHRQEGQRVVAVQHRVRAREHLPEAKLEAVLVLPEPDPEEELVHGPVPEPLGGRDHHLLPRLPVLRVGVKRAEVLVPLQGADGAVDLRARAAGLGRARPGRVLDAAVAGAEAPARRGLLVGPDALDRGPLVRVRLFPELVPRRQAVLLGPRVGLLAGAGGRARVAPRRGLLVRPDALERGLLPAVLLAPQLGPGLLERLAPPALVRLRARGRRRARPPRRPGRPAGAPRPHPHPARRPRARRHPA